MIETSTLNPSQRDAVEHCDGPTLVLAGAGSGKTRVLTYKIAHLVSKGIKPWRILAVTFTNKAARVMISRVENLLGMPADRLWIGTFHRICARIIRIEADKWGLRRDFTIYDENDSMNVVKKALKQLDIPKEKLPPGRVRHIIGKAKNSFIAPDELCNFITDKDAEVIAKVYRRYREIMNDAGAFDFDDLLVRPVEMFGKHPESLEKWRRKFDHLLVDEYQDTNRTQYLFMRLLAGSSGNVTVVGDDDQSIYSWRGADIRNILEFESDFEDVKTVRLEKNYRSTGTILHAANSVVANNRSRMQKRLWTDRPEGERVRLLECLSDRDEAERVIAAIEKERRQYRPALRDFVILYRTNAQSRAFEDVLRRRGIAYVIVGGLRFYERREIKDILAYLRFLSNPSDAVSFERAISVPKRGIGSRTVEMIEQFSAERHITILEALARADELFSAKSVIAKKIGEFYDLIRRVDRMRADAVIGELAQTIVKEIGYELYLRNEDPVTFEERMDNVNELITAMNEYENTTEEDDLAAFLSEVSLVTDVDTWDESTDAVTLMTLHSAKGLEFPSVFIVGAERGLFPLPFAFEEQAKLEEERRLFYVGITRAEERLHVSYALQRMRHGSVTGGASMFVSELPFEVLDMEVPEPLYRAAPAHRGHVRRRMEFEDYAQNAPYEESDARFRVGSCVLHPVFGRGWITASSGSGENTKLKIMFGTREKTILVKYARLMPG